MNRGRRSTPLGEHRPVLLEKVLQVLDPRPGQVVVDCTVGWAGHAVSLLERVGATGLLIGLDFDADNLPRAQERLAGAGNPFQLVHANFAGLSAVLGQLGQWKVDAILADLGMSSMQVDDPERGFSYRRDGALDMRMDRSKGRTAAQILQTISHDDLVLALRDLGDEPDAERIATALVRECARLQRTGDLVEVILQATGQTNWRLHPQPGRWNLHPAARTFQALRILVNREIANLENLIRIAPAHLQPGGTLAVISFHSGEDRVVKSAFRAGKSSGDYGAIAQDPLRASPSESYENPRARSAKLRWARTPEEKGVRNEWH